MAPDDAFITAGEPEPSMGEGSIEDFIPDPAGRQLRWDLTAAHLTHVEGSWMGYPAEPGFAVVTVASASALMSAITAAGRHSRVIECDWDGVSETGTGANGVTKSNLTVNASVDWGYNRSASNILVRPKAGRSPSIRSTIGQSAAGARDGRVLLTGLSRVEFRDITFDGCGLTAQRNSTFPEIAMLVVRRCTVLNNKAKEPGAIYAQGARLLHVEGCLFDGCGIGIHHNAHFMRSFNNGFVRHYGNDLHATRNYQIGYQAGWFANVWIAGCVAWALDPQSSAHMDLSQISTSNVEGHRGYKHLVEFCVYYADNGTQYSTQGVFGDDGAAQRYRCDHLIHNNVVAIGAIWAFVPYDPSDDGTKVVTRNLVARVGSGFGWGGGPQYDAYPRIVGSTGGQPFGTGRMIVSENYFTHEGDDTGHAQDDNNRWGNVNLDPRKFAAVAARPETLLTGGPAWGADVSGRTTYADPAPSSMTQAAAKAALLAFFEPKAGWRSAGAGPVDPALWPANPAMVATSSLAWPSDRVRTSQWLVTDAATGGAAVVEVSSLDAGVTGLSVVVDGGAPIPLAEPLVASHAISGLTNFSHSFALVASNAHGSSGPSAAKTCIVTGGNGILDFGGIRPTLTGAGTCTAIEGGWQWTNVNTGSRTLCWGVNGLMTPGRAYRLEGEVEADSLADAISARCAYNLPLTTVRGLNAVVTPSDAGVKQAFTLTVSAGTDTDYVGFFFAATGTRTITLTNLRLTPA